MNNKLLKRLKKLGLECDSLMSQLILKLKQRNYKIFFHKSDGFEYGVYTNGKYCVYFQNDTFFGLMFTTVANSSKPQCSGFALANEVIDLDNLNFEKMLGLNELLTYPYNINDYLTRNKVFGIEYVEI